MLFRSNLLFFGANNAYWRVRLEESAMGPDRRMAVYKIRKQDPNKEEATIRFRDLGQPDSALTGVTYTCFPVRGEFTITNASSWIFDGTDVRNGQTFSGIVGPEVDKLLSKTKYDDVLANSPATCGKKTPTHSTMLLRRDRSGAAIFAVGTMGWVLKALKGDAPQDSVDLVRTVTDNVLRASTTKGFAP